MAAKFRNASRPEDHSDASKSAMRTFLVHCVAVQREPDRLVCEGLPTACTAAQGQLLRLGSTLDSPATPVNAWYWLQIKLLAKSPPIGRDFGWPF